MKRLLFVAFALQTLTVLPVQGKTYEGVDGVIEPKVVATVQDKPAALSPDGEWLLAEIQNEKQKCTGVSLVNLKTGDRKVLVDGCVAWHERWLPDGQTFLFLGGAPTPEGKPQDLANLFVGNAAMGKVAAAPGLNVWQWDPPDSPNGRCLLLTDDKQDLKCVSVESTADHQGLPMVTVHDLGMRGYERRREPGPLHEEVWWRLYEHIWQGNGTLWLWQTVDDEARGNKPIQRTMRLEVQPTGVRQTEEPLPLAYGATFSPDGKWRTQTEYFPATVTGKFYVLPATNNSLQTAIITTPWVVTTVDWAPDAGKLSLREGGWHQDNRLRVLDLKGQVLANVNGIPGAPGWQDIGIGRQASFWDRTASRICFERSRGSGWGLGSCVSPSSGPVVTIPPREVGCLVLDIAEKKLWKLDDTDYAYGKLFFEFIGDAVYGWREGQSRSGVRKPPEYQIIRWSLPSGQT